FHADAFLLEHGFFILKSPMAQSGVNNEYFLHHRRRGRRTLRCGLLRAPHLNKTVRRDLWQSIQERRTVFAHLFRILHLWPAMRAPESYRSHYRIVLGLLGEFGANGPTWLAGGGSEPSSTPTTESIAIRTI